MIRRLPGARLFAGKREVGLVRGAVRRLRGAAHAAKVIVRHADARFTAAVFVLAAFALAFSGWLIVDAPIPLDRDLLAMSPRVFPYLVLLSTVAVAALFLLFRGRECGADTDTAEGRVGAAGTGDAVGAAEATGAAVPAGKAGPGASTLRQFAFLVIAVACALLLDTMGFLITMFMLMAGTSILVGNRNPAQILGISILIPLGFYIAVTHVMRTALPEIDLVQRALAPLLRLLPAF